MRNIVFAFILLMFFSCKKETDRVTMNLSLLEQFDWQNIKYSEEEFILDKSQKIKYSDTSHYSFNNNKFIFFKQSTNIVTILGSEKPTYNLYQSGAKTEGMYEINASENTLKMTYTSYIGGNSGWGIPGVATTIHTKYKIILLNSDTLKLKSLPNEETSIPFLERVETYSSVKK